MKYIPGHDSALHTRTEVESFCVWPLENSGRVIGLNQGVILKRLKSSSELFVKMD